MTEEEELKSIAYRRGIFFPSAEIFGGISGFFEYGPIGLRIFNNVINEWRKFLYRINAIEISGCIILPQIVMQASGHVNNFFDYVIKCNKCGAINRIDKLIEEQLNINVEGENEEYFKKILKENKVKCPGCGNIFSPESEIFKYNLMMKTNVANEEAFLRPEACQSIFLDFNRIYSIEGKLPLIIAQVGKAFRNEISPRNYLIRERELYQNDIEVFFEEDNFEPSDLKFNLFIDKNNYLSGKEALEKGLLESKVSSHFIPLWNEFLVSLGFKQEEIRFRKLDKDKAFYAKEAYDVEIFDGKNWVEVTAINHRGKHDLSRYAEFGAKLSKITNIFEISCGTDRLIYLLLLKSIRKDEKRTWLSLNNKIAPYAAEIVVVVKKDELIKKALEIYNKIENKEDVYLLISDNIGKAYRKGEEIGIPFAFTIDYQTLEDNTVTIRDRETTQQKRINSEEINDLVRKIRKEGFTFQ
ncbi:MAG: glycine--tRNA ligase [Candidatus Rehaiarchaeum fermentans]|nr:glycine--tRNA ligase [Candidatus Rehaiarchaeum fermentans]MCW1297080.1 glycine--tRNA ligase [Candidatus Rehaiarchaeum fermentans]MCW1302450.1 glycine--tRNA ligase [Candidatus Rehaiarchaeum fermentans]